MMNRKLVGAVVFATVCCAGIVSAQKATLTSAVLEFRNYGTALRKSNMDGAKSALIKAKEYIDAAAKHDETKDNPKMYYYKGEIYTSFLTLSMVSKDMEFAKKAGDNVFDEAIAAYKSGYEVSNKYDGEIKESIYKKKMELEGLTGMLYEAEKFGEAVELYDTQVKLSDAIGEVDTLSMFNAGICAEKAGKSAVAGERYANCAKYGYKAPEIYSIASSVLRKAGKTADAKAVIAEGRKKYPSDRNMLLELVNANLDEGNAEAAEKSLQEAISADPNNKQLYYVIGTIYIDMKKDAEAEAALNKAIELDPNYSDAQYQLGAHLVGVAGNLKQEASQLKFGDPKYDEMMAKSDEYYKKSLVPLEAYIGKNPNDKDVLTILFQIHKNLKNTEKALEYKRRADAL
ncbi:MAG: tetratricopeptide repeat protein [Bacteroidetes bacterium]|nr:MAG: tetratricopeptide repeat protein [Bacteroidota bacterium]